MPSAVITTRDGQKVRLTADTPEALDAQVSEMTGPGEVQAGAGADALQEGFVSGAESRLRKYGDAALRPFRTVEENVDAATEEIIRNREAEERMAEIQARAPGDVGVERAGAFGRGAGDIAPDIAAGGLAGMGRGIGARVVGGTIASAGSALADDPYSELNKSNLALGTGFGLVASAVGEVPNIVRSVAGSRIRSGYKQIGVEGVPDDGSMLRATEDAQLAQIDVFPAEATDSQRLQRAESMTPSEPGNPKYDAIRRRSDQVVQHFERSARALGTSKANAPAVLEAASRVFDNAVDDIKLTAQREFANALAPAIAATGAKVSPEGIITGGTRAVPIANHLRVYRLQLDRAIESGADPREIMALWRRVSSQGDRITLGGLQTKLSVHGSGSVGGGTTAKQALDAEKYLDDKQLFKALMTDVDEAITNPPPDLWGVDPATARTRFEDIPGTPEVPQGPPGQQVDESAYGGGQYIPKDQPAPGQRAAGRDFEARRIVTGEQARAASESLKEARDAYRVAIEPLNRLQKQGIDALLGSEKLLGTEEFAKKFRAMDIEQQTAVFKLLDARRPALADKLRGVIFLDTVRQSKTSRAGAAAAMEQRIPETIDVAKMGQLLTDQPERWELLLPRTLGPGQRKQVRAGFEVVSRITRNRQNMEKALGGNFRSILNELEQGTINAIERHPGFLGRFLAGEVGPHVLERWLYTDAGLKALMRIGESQPARGAAVAAVREPVRTLIELDVEAEVEREKLIERAKAEEAIKENERRLYERRR